MKSRLIFFLFAILVEKTISFYENSDVTELNMWNFDELVLESDKTWIVLFYSPWSSASEMVVAEYKRIAQSFKDSNSDVGVGAMDVWYDESFYDQLDINSFPTIKLYGRDKSLPITCFSDSDNITLELVREFVFEYLESEADFYDDEDELRRIWQFSTTAAWEFSTQTTDEASGVWEYSTQNEDETTELWATSESSTESQQRLDDKSSSSDRNIGELSTQTEEEALEVWESSTQTEDATTEQWTSSESTSESQQRLDDSSSSSDRKIWELSTQTEEEALELWESSTQTEDVTTELWTSSESTSKGQQRLAVNSASSYRKLSSVFVLFIILNIFAFYNS